MSESIPSLLNRNLGRSQLNGALPGDIRDEAVDKRDAQDIMDVLRALEEIRGNVDVANRGTFKTALRPRGFLERAWECRRRRGKTLSNKFAFGGLWSKTAHELTFDGDVLKEKGDWSNKILLEHVVPAEAVVQVLNSMIVKGTTPELIGSALYDLFHHVVISRQEDASLSRKMTNEDVDRLVMHHTGEVLLSREEHEKLIWRRYPDQLIRDFRVPVP